MLYQPINGWWLYMDVGLICGRQWRWFELLPVMAWAEFDVRGSRHVGYLWQNMNAFMLRFVDVLLRRSLDQPHKWYRFIKDTERW